MAPLVDLKDKRFGSLIVVGRAPRKGAYTGARWVCMCDCGRSTIVARGNLMTGDIKSCGCQHAIKTRQRMTKHGCAGTPEYKIWKGMVARCHNKNRKAYAAYGALGIVVCDRWRSSFAAFLSDMGSRPSPDHSVDRYPDMQGNYEPRNCRWATDAEQAENQQNGVSLILNGELMSLSDAAKKLGVTYFSARWKYWSRPPVRTCGVPT